jgi:hypothetical protein
VRVGAHLPHRGGSPTRTLHPARVLVHAVGPAQIRLGVRSPAAASAIRSISDGAARARRTRASRGFPVGVQGLWRRFSDDRDLFRVKIILLAGLVALAAVLERVV